MVEDLESKLQELRDKQDKIETAWKKTGRKELLQFFIDILPKAVGAERCSIFVLDQQKKNVWSVCGTGIQEMEISVPARGSLVGDVILSGKPRIVSDMQQMVGAHDVVSLKTGYSVRNTVCVPVFGITTEGVTGAIQALNSTGIGGFNEKDQMLLEQGAYHMQMFIENLFLRQDLAKFSLQLKKQIQNLESQKS